MGGQTADPAAWLVGSCHRTGRRRAFLLVSLWHAKLQPQVQLQHVLAAHHGPPLAVHIAKALDQRHVLLNQQTLLQREESASAGSGGIKVTLLEANLQRLQHAQRLK